MSKRVRRVPETTIETMNIRVFQDHNYTSFVIESDGQVIGMGDARRNPEDPVNLEIAGTLAMGRAFADVGRKALKRAEGLIKHADDVQEAKAAVKAERAIPKTVWEFFTSPGEPQFTLTDTIDGDTAVGTLLNFLAAYFLPEIDDAVS